MDMVILFGLLGVFLLAGMQVPIALGAAALATILFATPLDAVIVVQKSVGTMAKAWPLLTIPMFIMLGEIFKVGGISQRVVAVANIMVGRMPGGLGVVNIVASYFFGGISGSAAADTSAIGGIMIPMMKKQGYPSTFSTVVTITSSTLGPIVPPSVLVILIAWVTDLSVGTLFLAGYVPGLVTMLGLIAVNVALAIRHDYPRHPTPPFGEALRVIANALPTLITPLIIVFGIVSGVMTIVESSAVALAYSVVIAGFFYREIRIKDFAVILRNTVATTAFVGMLLAFASAFAWLVVFSGLPATVAEALTASGIGPISFMLISMVIFLVLGTFLNAGEIVLLAMPILFPAALAIGIDPIHYCMIAALSMVIGNVTPPVGLCLFIGCAISGDRIEACARRWSR
ncbi:MAG: TRAP transporter large permease [Burkholderiaceae bacterium]|nr:TRAP transporter large permease [Burkholderiaceae bacterium]